MAHAVQAFFLNLQTIYPVALRAIAETHTWAR